MELRTKTCIVQYVLFYHPLLSYPIQHNPHSHSVSNTHYVWYVWCVCEGEANTNRFVLIIVICAVISGVVGGVTSQLNKFKDSKVVTPPSQVNSTLSLNSTSNSTSSARMVGRMFIS
jgi:membrane associated rhomboid family serine protease